MQFLTQKFPEKIVEKKNVSFIINFHKCYHTFELILIFLP